MELLPYVLNFGILLYNGYLEQHYKQLRYAKALIIIQICLSDSDILTSMPNSFRARLLSFSSLFKDKKANQCLSSLHAKYVVVPVEKASNNIGFIVQIITMGV